VESTRDHQRRNHTGNQGTSAREQRRKEEYATVHGDFRHAWEVRRSKYTPPVNRSLRERNPEEPSGRGEDTSLDHELTDDPWPRCAKRCSDSKFRSAADGPDEQQIREIATADGQQDTNGCEQDPQHLLIV